MKKRTSNSINKIKRISEYSIFCLNNKFSNAKNKDLKLLYKFNKNRPLGPQKLFCLAPFNAMFFDPKGRVKPCWDITGDYEYYPDKSLKEIWNGDKFKKLRENFSKNELSLICGICKKSLSDKNFNNVKATKFDHYTINKNAYPSYMEFVCENTCNLECVMCNGELSSSIRSNRDCIPALKSPYDNTFVQQLVEFIPHLKVANFIGGEPFLIKMYYEIWDLMAKMNPEISIFITTNATILNEKIKNILNNGNFSFNISLDSLKKEVFEKIRKNASFEKVFNNILEISEYAKLKKTSLSINMCIIRENWKEVPDMINFCNKIGCSIYFCDVIQPENHVIWTLNSTEIEKIIDYLSGFKFPTMTRNEAINNEQFEIYLKKLKYWYNLSETNENSQQNIIGLNKEQIAEILINHYSNYINSTKYIGLEDKITEAVYSAQCNFFTKELIDKLFIMPDDLVLSVFINESKETVINQLLVLKYSLYCK